MIGIILIVVSLGTVIFALFWDFYEAKSLQNMKDCYAEEEIALAEFLDKRQEINELFLVSKAELMKIQRR